MAVIFWSTLVYFASVVLFSAFSVFVFLFPICHSLFPVLLLDFASSHHATFRTLDPNRKNEESVHGSDSLFALVLSAGICRRCLRALTFARVNNLNLFAAASSINRRAAYAPSTLTPIDAATQRVLF